MRHLALTVAFLLVVIPPAAIAQLKPKSDPNYDIKRCAPKLLGKKVTSGGKPLTIHWRKGEKRISRSPIVALEILESGDVSNIRLKRSSGVADIDKYALDWVKQMRYNRRPGCGSFDSEVGVNVDF
jgi:TonB family protein